MQLFWSDWSTQLLESLTLEMLALKHLRPLVNSVMDPLQFAYQPGVGVNEAVIHQLDRALCHLKKPGSTVRISFFGFLRCFSILYPAKSSEGQAGICWSRSSPVKLDPGLPYQPTTVCKGSWLCLIQASAAQEPEQTYCSSIPFHPVHWWLQMQVTVMSSAEVLQSAPLLYVYKYVYVCRDFCCRAF